MLDFNNLDFSNICENWFLNFNDFLKDDKFNYDNLFYSESHWRDFVSITGDIITFTGNNVTCYCLLYTSDAADDQ